MKALSLWQPWASFIAAGIKPFETRSWAPPAGLIGQRIAIHAAKKPVSADDREWARRVGIDALPLGEIVCTATLRGAYRSSGSGPVVNPVLPIRRERMLAFEFPDPPLTVQGTRIAASVPGSPVLLSLRADEYGDYAAGRWAWLLTDVEPFDPPIPARGARGVWDWHEDAAGDRR